MHATLRRASAMAALVLLTACSSIPPLTRSVSVQRNPGAGTSGPVSTSASRAPAATSAGPLHASGILDGDTYHVVRGDTLYSIAFLAGVDVRQLAAWNHIQPPYVIYPGQTLQLKPRGVAAAGASVAAAPPPATAPMFETVPAEPVTAPSAPPSTTAAPPKPSPTPAANGSLVAAASPASPPAAAGNVGNVVPVAGSPVTATPAPSVVKVTPGKSREVSGIRWSWPADGKLLSTFSKGDAIPGINIAGQGGDPVRAAADGVVVYSGNGLVGYGELVIIKHNDDYLSAYGHNRKRLVKEGERVRAGQVIAEMGSSGAPRDELQFQVRRDGTPVDPLDYLPGR